MVMRRILGTIILFQLQLQPSVLIVASFSSSQNRGNDRLCGHRRQATDGLSEQSISNQLLPATSMVHFQFSTARDIIPNNMSMQLPLKGNAQNQKQKQRKQQQLVLHRRDGIDLYGRKVVHDENDARTGKMSFLHAESLERTSAIWDATMVLGPEKDDESSDSDNDDKDDDDSLLFSIGNSQSCFVAMNRFQVKEDCKNLFEERWAQRNSKLPRQSGFIGFSLLRKRAMETSCEHSRNEYDRFNYSTCTIWDSMDSWECWRNGGGKTSHEASRETNAGQKRVPVSEWLEGPSSPIFWGGTVWPIEEMNDARSKTELVSE
eukprot:CAMPEP_0116131132 /NCGR_PEP_ID=MMETSP0329-20121206/8843_1 /TAXON_ID=697910 /ORGANISM="Pseudo-nitzschia arenysensis, Strain B593" /LENGTH=318 /DNA_ID=CAMNT_0003625543 /DNA_START=73 /DNA_END=1032 /DNA_ORIENTATION=+